MTSIDSLIDKWQATSETSGKNINLIPLKRLTSTTQKNGRIKTKLPKLKGALKESAALLYKSPDTYSLYEIDTLHELHSLGLDEIISRKKIHVSWSDHQLMIAHTASHKGTIAGIRAHKSKKEDKISWLETAVQDFEKSINHITSEKMKLRPEDFKFIMVTYRRLSFASKYLGNLVEDNFEWRKKEVDAIEQAGIYNLTTNASKGTLQIARAKRESNKQFKLTKKKKEKIHWATKAYETSLIHADLIESKTDSEKMAKTYSGVNWYIMQLMELTDYDPVWLDKNIAMGKKIIEFAKQSNNHDRLIEGYTTIAGTYRRQLGIYRNQKGAKEKVRYETKDLMNIAVNLYDLLLEEAEFRELHQLGDVVRAYEEASITAYHIYRSDKKNDKWFENNAKAAKKVYRLIKQEDPEKAAEIYAKVTVTGAFVMRNNKKHAKTVLEMTTDAIELIEERLLLGNREVYGPILSSLHSRQYDAQERSLRSTRKGKNKHRGKKRY